MMLHFAKSLVTLLMLVGLVGKPVTAKPLQLMSAAQAAGYVPGQLIVKFTPDVAGLIKTQLGAKTKGKPDFRGVPSLDQFSRHFGLIDLAPVFNFTGNTAALRSNGLSQIYILTVPSSVDIWQMAADYKADPHVIYAEPNYIAGLPEVVEDDPGGSMKTPHREAIFPDDTAFAEQYALHNTGQSGGIPDADVDAPEAWQIQTGDPSVLIAILDTGVNYNHTDLIHKVRLDLDWDFIDQDGDALDTFDHGTRVAGVAAAHTNNGAGISGMCWNCQILPVRVGTGIVHFTSLAVAQGIVYATLVGARVINMSLGGQCSDLWADAVNFAYDNDVVLVAVAGNIVDFVAYPALFNRVIAVSATDQNDQFAGFSSFGPAVDIAAPGERVKVTTLGGGLTTSSGTSYAAALTSGLVGLLQAENPDLTNAQVQQILQASAEDLGAPGFDRFFGYGRINAHRALSLAFAPPPVAHKPGPDVCGCLLDQAMANLAKQRKAPEAVFQQNKLDLLHRLRDEILMPTPLGRQIATHYYRHSPQALSLILRDASLRNQLRHLLDASLPYLISLLEEDGQKPLEAKIIDQTYEFIQALAGQANPELRADLLQTWQTLDLKLYMGRPVKEALSSLGRSPRQFIFLPIITKAF